GRIPDAPRGPTDSSGPPDDGGHRPPLGRGRHRSPQHRPVLPGVLPGLRPPDDPLVGRAIRPPFRGWARAGTLNRALLHATVLVRRSTHRGSLRPGVRPRLEHYSVDRRPDPPTNTS